MLPIYSSQVYREVSFQVIGATTLDEYRNIIEKDAALERRFQPVMVEEPSVDDTISILEDSEIDMSPITG